MQKQQTVSVSQTVTICFFGLVEMWFTAAIVIVNHTLRNFKVVIQKVPETHKQTNIID